MATTFKFINKCDIPPLNQILFSHSNMFSSVGQLLNTQNLSMYACVAAQIQTKHIFQFGRSRYPPPSSTYGKMMISSTLCSSPKSLKWKAHTRIKTATTQKPSSTHLYYMANKMCTFNSMCLLSHNTRSAIFSLFRTFCSLSIDVNRLSSPPPCLRPRPPASFLSFEPVVYCMLVVS